MYTQSGKLKKKYTKRAGNKNNSAARTAAEAAMQYVGQYVKPSSRKINYEALKVQSRITTCLPTYIHAFIYVYSVHTHMHTIMFTRREMKTKIHMTATSTYIEAQMVT